MSGQQCLTNDTVVPSSTPFLFLSELGDQHAGSASHTSPALELHEALERELSSGHSSGPFQSLPRQTHTTLVCSTHEAGEQDSIGRKGSAAKGCNPFISSNPFQPGALTNTAALPKSKKRNE